MVAWGFFVALWTGVGEGKWTNPNQWRLGFAIQGIPALILLVGALLIPESPRWLCLKNRHEEAEAAFRRYHHNGSNDEWCAEQFALIRVNIEEEVEAQGRLSWSDLFRTSSFRKRLFVGSFVWAAAMLSGISFVQYYQTAIYATLNFGEERQLLVSGLYGSVAPVACIISLFFIDKIGRKTVLVTSSGLLSLSYTIITILAAIYPAIPGQPTNDAAQRGLIACIFAVSANYSALLGPMTWIVPYVVPYSWSNQTPLTPTQARGLHYRAASQGKRHCPSHPLLNQPGNHAVLTNCACRGRLEVLREGAPRPHPLRANPAT